MKKIYSVALIFLALWAPSVNAQCPPGANAKAFIGTGSSGCWVVIQNGLPNATVNLLDAANNPLALPAPSTDANGYAFVFYSCNSSPAVVNLVASGTVCTIFIAAAVNLPIKIKTFTAQSQNDASVLLRWTSVLEANASKYVIQKSTDGRNFTDISEVKAAGNSVTALNYSYLDRQMASSSAYYRLKLVDLDGTVDYTKIVYINNGTVGLLNLSVFPNPFRNEVQLKGVTSSDVNSKNIKIYSSMGSEVAYRVIGGNSIVVDPALPKGVYILRVKGQTYKLFKE